MRLKYRSKYALTGIVRACLLLIFATLTSAALAEDELPADLRDFYIGGGAYIQTQPYEGHDPLVVPTPVLFADNRLFYVRWTRVGMYVFGQQNWGVSITAQPRPFGYKSGNAAVLNGMSKREPSWEAGMAIGGEFGDSFAELTWFHDVGNKSNGSLLRFELGRFFKTGKWTIVPSVFAIRYDNSFNDYYYGVRTDESTLLRPIYIASAGYNFAAQSYFKYSYNEHWHFLGNLRGDLLASTIEKSPLVGSPYMLSGLISIIYSFGY